MLELVNIYPIPPDTAWILALRPVVRIFTHAYYVLIPSCGYPQFWGFEQDLNNSVENFNSIKKAGSPKTAGLTACFLFAYGYLLTKVLALVGRYRLWPQYPRQSEGMEDAKNRKR